MITTMFGRAWSAAGVPAADTRRAIAAAETASATTIRARALGKLEVDLIRAFTTTRVESQGLSRKMLVLVLK